MTRLHLCVLSAVVAASARLAAADGAGGADPAEVARRARESVGRVFARPEFDPLAKADEIPVPHIPESARSWIQKIYDALADFFGDALKALGNWIGGFLRWLFRGLGKLFGGGGTGASAQWIPTWAMWALGALAVGILVFVVVRLVRASERERAARAAAATLSGSAVGEDDALSRSPEDWRRTARELAAGGARRDALRALYLALLASLHRVGAIRYDRTRTNTAYVTDLAPGHPARAPFRSVTRRFDDAWYGGHEPSAGDIGSANEEAEDVLHAFRQEARSA